MSSAQGGDGIGSSSNSGPEGGAGGGTSSASQRNASFRTGGFDFVLHSAQIVAVLAAHYLSLCLVLSVACSMAGDPLTLANLFSYSHTSEWSVFCAVLLAAAIDCALFVIIVQRAKLVLDFAVTVFAVHLFLTTSYSRSLPASVMWYTAHVSALLITAIGGENLCLRHELEPILVGSMATSAIRERERMAQRSSKDGAQADSGWLLSNLWRERLDVVADSSSSQQRPIRP
ncbi:hypothetical protein RI367_007832 [Sorochytrium milnesiophthora]